MRKNPRPALLRRSLAGALLVAWWQAKAGQAQTQLTWLDAATLAGIGILWLQERRP